MSRVRQNYLNQTFPGSYSGLSGFLKSRKNWKDKHEVDKELRKIRGYALHEPVKYKFPKRKIVVHFPSEMWATDLKSIQGISKENNGYNYLLVIVDAFSKRAYVRPLKDKTANSMMRAFNSIFKEAGLKPMVLFSDRGSEYTSHEFQKFLTKNRIKWITSYSITKSAFAEKFIGTFFQKIQRYMTEKQTNSFVNKLQDFVKSYNGTVHTSTGFAPNKINERNTHEAWTNMYGKYIEKMKKPRKPPKFKEGDLVRISKSKLTFEKGKNSEQY